LDKEVANESYINDKLRPLFYEGLKLTLTIKKKSDIFAGTPKKKKTR